MDWFEEAIMATALILLGIAIIFLVYGALTGVFDEKKWYKRQYASLKKRSTPETELTVEEKQALQAKNKNLRSEENHFSEESDSDHTRPRYHRSDTSH